ncbi:MAG TPA: hypothetical protein VIA61_01970 [Methylomirabilota bacterium]|jgi:hypothetical protein
MRSSAAVERVDVTCALLLVLGLLTHVGLIIGDSVDDAYISFRYAANLAHGHGLVFNPGEWVEGYSNLTWVLLTAAFVRAGVHPDLGMRWVALLCLVATVVVVMITLARVTGSRVASLAAALVLVTSSMWIAASVNGLEGGLFSLLLIVVVALGTRLWRSDSLALSVGLSLAGVVLAMTRPEGCLLFLAYLVTSGAAWWVRARATARSRRFHALLLTGGAFAVGVLGLLAWRLATYGSTVPNTVIAKIGPDGSAGIRLLSGLGVWYLLGFALSTWYLWLALAYALVAVARGRNVEGLLTFGPGLILPLAGAVVALANRGDWMPHYRLMAPYVPVLVMSIVGLLASSSPSSRRAVWPGAALATLALVGGPSYSELHPIAPRFLWETPGPGLWGQLGQSLEEARAPWVRPRFATEVLGRFSYYAPGTTIIDLNGLTDSVIARHEPAVAQFGRRTRPDTLRALGPDVIAFNDLSYWRTLLSTGWFAAEYVPLSCDVLLSAEIYAFVRREAAFRLERIALCPHPTLTDHEAFRRAMCLRTRTWRYDFPRECREQRDGRTAHAVGDERTPSRVRAGHDRVRAAAAARSCT